jgi:hypothetical protein
VFSLKPYGINQHPHSGKFIENCEPERLVIDMTSAGFNADRLQIEWKMPLRGEIIYHGMFLDLKMYKRLKDVFNYF